MSGATITLSVEFLIRLDTLCLKAGRPRSEVIRKALQTYE